MATDPLIEKFDRQTGFKDKYSELANPDAPRTITGDNLLNEFDRVTGFVDETNQSAPENQSGAPQIIPEFRSDTNTFIPDLGAVYENQQLDPNNMAGNVRRKAVGAALKESIKTEEQLKAFGLGDELPKEGNQFPEGASKFLTVPLEALKQLQRGQFAVVGGLKGALEGDPELAFKNFYRGLLMAEEHSFQDILQRHKTFRENKLASFVLGFAGDVAADPLTWLSFGTSALAKGAITGGLKTAAEVTPFLSKFGKQALREAMETVPEKMAVQAIVDEVAKGTRLGKKLIPGGVRVSRWVPAIGDSRLTDLLPLVPGGVMQRINDLEATQKTLDAVTDVLVNSKFVDWFGKAFVPYWDVRRKYPILMEIEKELKAKNHYRAQDLIERGKQIVKLLPDEKDRELLTELLEKPWLITGKKFTQVSYSEPGVPQLIVNMDYFPADRQITEENAEEFVDFFIKASQHVNIPELGRGANGRVFGNLEPLRSAFEGMKVNVPDAKEYKIWMGDWVVKIPGLRIAEGHPPYEEAIADALGEAYIGKRLHGIVGIPEARVVYRQMKDLNPGMVSKEKIGLRDLSRDINRRHIAWGHMLGAWKKYVRSVPEDQREIKEFSEFVKLGLDSTVGTDEVFVPIVVKRLVKGDTIDSVIDQIGLKIRTNKSSDLDEGLQTIYRFMDSYNELINNIARTGVGIGDLHSANVMFDQVAGQAHIVDYARYADYARGVASPYYPIPPVGVPRSAATGAEIKIENLEDLDMLIGRFGMTDLPAATNIRKLEELVGNEQLRKIIQPHQMRAAQKSSETWPQMLPESPIMELIRGPITSKIGEEGEQAFRNHMSRAYKIAKLQMLKAAENFAGIELDINELASEIVRRVHVKDGREAALNLAEKVAARFTKSGSHIVGIEKDKLGNFFGFNFKMNGAAQYIPIQKRIAAVPKKTWTETVETVATKHPDFLSMSPEKQDRMLRAYDLTRDWKDEIEASLLNRNLIGQARLDGFKRKFGLEHIPHIKKMVNPFDLVTSLQVALKNRIKIGNLKGREIEGAISEINREFGLEFFESDVASILTKHAIDVAAATDSFDSIAEAARLFGKPMKFKNVKAKNGHIIARPDPDAGFMHVNHPALEGIQIPNEVADWIQRYSRVFTGDKSGKMFWSKLHRIMGLWKGYATFVNPGFHGRNFPSNMFQLYLKDGPEAFNPVIHKKAVDILRGREGFFGLDNGQKFTNAEVSELAKRYGVYGTGWFGADIKSTDDVKALLTGNKKVFDGFNPLSFNNFLFQAGKYVGGGIENEARMVGFLTDLKRTGNPAQAAEQTKKFLFDYTDITDFERDWVKLFVPFYVWMKKNTLLQAEQIIRNPGKYGNIERIRDNLEAQSPQADPRFLPKYFPEIYAARTPLKSGVGSPVYINPNLPFQDLNKVFDPKDWINSLGPWKAMFELALNKQLFTRKDIEKFKGEVSAAPWLELLPQDVVAKVGPMIGAHRYYDADNQTWLWGVPPKIKYAVETANPMFRNFGKAISAATSNYPAYQREKLPYDVLAWTTGVKLIPYNPTAEMEKSVFQRRDMLRDFEKTASQQGRIPSKYLPDVKLPESH